MPEGSPGLEAAARRMAEFGPFFAVEAHRAPASAATGQPGSPHAPGEPATPWRTVADFTDAPATLHAYIDLVRAKLAAANGRPVDRIEPRVAASVAHLGLLARLLSPVLGVAALCGAFPSLEPHDTYWQPELGGAFPLSLAVVPPTGTPPWPTVERLTAAFPVSPHILRDNVASALNGAAATVVRAAPALAPVVRDVLSALLGDRAFSRRRSCCLIYRAAPPGRAGLCGDCPLDHPPRRRSPPP